MCGSLFQMSQREGFGFHFIIVYGGRAMGIDKADVLEGCSCLLHGLADSEKSPSPVREGPEIWLASLLMAPPERMMLFGVFSVLSNTAPQASPKFSPSRLLSYGRHGRELRDRKDRKPLVMK